MSNVSYDLDTSGGLMPLIRALIKPPDDEPSTQKTKKPQHPYYKRPGKGHNHDSCDACGEGGDLICCDRCPASFHLGCYDPPLDEADIPAGLWLCRECRASDAEKPSSARGSRAQSPVEADKKTRTLRHSRANSEKKKGKEDEEDTTEPVAPSPMEELVRAARILNPKQFELPREMRVPCLFPGTEKEGTKNGNSSLVTVDSSGCVPIPAKLCFVCQGTCKAAPLLQCDYCPLLFHQDCLDPPLTALPTGRWMCPNHVEQYIDWKVVKSISATERVALWDRFSAPVDQHAIKIDFIRRARNPNRPFRVKVPVGVSGRVVVPEMVRYHYRRPPPLLPSRRELARCCAVINNMRENKDFDMASELDTSAPKHKICLNMSCPQYFGKGPCPLDDDAKDKHMSPNFTQDEEKVEGKQESGEEKEEKHTDSSSELSDSDFEYLTASVKRRRVEPKSGTKLQLKADDDVEYLLRTVGQQLEQLDGRLVRLLAWQRLQQVVWGEQGRGMSAGSGVGARVAAAVRRSVAGARLAARGHALPSALLGPADRRRIAAAVWGPAAPPAHRATPLADNAALANDHLVRATVSRLYHGKNGAGETVGPPIAMRLAVFSIGTDTSCDLRLEPICRRLAPKHATIFMDEVSRHFELINYSEWGTEVNGVLYTCDVRPRERTPADGAADGGPLQQLIARRKPPVRRINGELTQPLGDEGPCRCALGVASRGAWEGSALVPHGALLKFGCQEYVFSITDELQFYPSDEDDE